MWISNERKGQMGNEWMVTASEVPCERCVSPNGESPAEPPDVKRVTEPTDQSMDLGQRRVEWETELGRENLVATSLEVCQGTRI